MATFILVVHTLLAIALCAVILMQRSEGGGLGIGGGNAGGLMTARGAADLLTRSTTILAGLFVGTSIILAVLAAQGNKTRRIDTSLAAPAATAPARPAPVPAAPPAGGVPLAQ